MVVCRRFKEEELEGDRWMLCIVCCLLPPSFQATSPGPRAQWRPWLWVWMGPMIVHEYIAPLAPRWSEEASAFCLLWDERAPGGVTTYYLSVFIHFFMRMRKETLDL